MNSCSTMVHGVATLSSTDKLGLQSFYGNPTPSSFKKDAIGWDGENYYFFFGRNVTLFSVAADLIVDYYPRATGSVFMNWPTASPWTSGVDAALDYSSTKVYLFSGNQYLRLTKATKTVDAGYPRTLPGDFANWPTSWTSVTTGLKMNGKLYLFRGSEYLRMTGTTVDAGYPKPISGNWNVGFTSNIDYGFVYPNGKGYFFKGQDYTRVTISANTESVDAGYPKKIVGRWKGITF